MNRTIKKYARLIAIFWIATLVSLPSFSLVFTQVIHAEEAQEQDFDKEESELGEFKEEFIETNLKGNGKLENPILKLEEKNAEDPIKDEQPGEFGTEITAANSITATTEDQLIEAVNNPAISEIIKHYMRIPLLKFQK